MWSNILRFVKGQILFSKRLRNELQSQEKNGYTVKQVSEGPVEYLEYRQGELHLTAETRAINIWGDWCLFVNSYTQWDDPEAQELTRDQLKTITSRLVAYLTCWGGKVVLDYEPYADAEELKSSLEERGIGFTEIDGVFVYELPAERIHRPPKSKHPS